MSRYNTSGTFPGMPPTPRLHRPWWITEKINGLNGFIAIDDNLMQAERDGWPLPLYILEHSNNIGRTGIWAGSKTQWVKADGDAYGFGNWVAAYAKTLIDVLGVGIHRGEWWGNKVRTSYDLPAGEKRFSLFNTSRWTRDELDYAGAPEALHVVPLLAADVDGHALNREVNRCLDHLEKFGSLAAPGFMRPEGVVAFQPSSQVAFKATIRNDDVPKGTL